MPDGTDTCRIDVIKAVVGITLNLFKNEKAKIKSTGTASILIITINRLFQRARNLAGLIVAMVIPIKNIDKGTVQLPRACMGSKTTEGIFIPRTTRTKPVISEIVFGLSTFKIIFPFFLLVFFVRENTEKVHTTISFARV